MAVYAIGDVQGCYANLRALLRKIEFDPVHDRLWFTGDLVNRGPQSAEVVRFIADLGERAVTVLGNHDLHLLAVAAGAAPLLPSDTFADLLDSFESEHLLTWLRQRPLFHRDASIGYSLVHAGLLPQWDVAQAQAYAREVEALLIDARSVDLFHHMYGDKPDRWHSELTGWGRLRLIVNAFTRLRFCDPDGRIDFRHKGPPGSQPPRLVPWFKAPSRRSQTERLVFGHWSTLGRWDRNGVIGLDTGCCWGGHLTAVRLAGGPREFITVPGIAAGENHRADAKGQRPVQN